MHASNSTFQHLLHDRYGHLTWEWAAGLRSYLHPSLYALLYWFLQALHLDYPLFIAKGPQLLQACCAALTDLAVYRISLHMHGMHVAKYDTLRILVIKA